MLPYRTTSGSVDGVVVTYSDITDLRHAEELSSHLASFPKLNPNPVLETDAAGRIIYANPGSTAILESLGLDKGAGDIFLPPDLDKVLASWDKRSSMVFDREIAIGNRIIAETVHLVPELEVVRIYAHDITERIRADEALRESERRYRELVQNANSAIIRWKTDGTIVFFNEFAESFFGYNAEEIIGRSVGLLLPEAESSGGDLTGLVREIVDHPERYVNFVNENVCRDGRRVWMAWTNKPIFAADGQAAEILAVGSDITGRKQAEETLRENERKYRELFENMISGFAFHKLITDKTGNPVDYIFLEINPAFEELTGLKRTAILGKPVTEAIPGIEDDPVDWIGTYGKVVLTGKSVQFEQRSERLEKWFSVSAYCPMQGHFATIFEDITERKRTEAGLAAME